jgi:hypothetical protein
VQLHLSFSRFRRQHWVHDSWQPHVLETTAVVMGAMRVQLLGNTLQRPEKHTVAAAHLLPSRLLLL